jgi:hypothetical protein
VKTELVLGLLLIGAILALMLVLVLISQRRIARLAAARPATLREALRILHDRHPD